MTDNKRHSRRDSSGRFAPRRPVPDVNAESSFDPVGNSVEHVENVSGAASPSTRMHPRYAPDADDLAAGGSWPLHARSAVLVPAGDKAATVYGNVQGALTRAAARDGHGDLDPTLALTDPFGAHSSTLMGVIKHDV